MYVAAAVMDIVAVLPANEQLILPAILVNQCCMILSKPASCCACAMQQMGDFVLCKALEMFVIQHIGGQLQNFIHDELEGFFAGCNLPYLVPTRLLVTIISAVNAC